MSIHDLEISLKKMVENKIDVTVILLVGLWHLMGTLKEDPGKLVLGVYTNK